MGLITRWQGQQPGDSVPSVKIIFIWFILAPSDAFQGGRVHCASIAMSWMGFMAKECPAHVSREIPNEILKKQ